MYNSWRDKDDENNEVGGDMKSQTRKGEIGRAHV